MFAHDLCHSQIEYLMKSVQKTVILLLLLALPASCSVPGFVKLSKFDQSNSVSEPNITLVSWNAQKGWDSQFAKDLMTLLNRNKPDFIFLQEAHVDLLQNEEMAGYFANGWKFPWPGGATIGVVTLSKAAPVRVQPVPSKYREFFVTSPKVSLVTEYLLPGGERLLAVNIHLLNFERWGTMRFRSQLDDLKSIMADHAGPIILAGDFNTWNRKRLGLVQKLAEDLRLKEVTDFPPGRKTGDMGFSAFNWLFGIHKDLPLDRVYYRGFTARHPRILPYESSDHRPLLVELTQDTQ
jgi:endonuclease/exonuclease/phosphatase (EEP) superfamily protein YafD